MTRKGVLAMMRPSLEIDASSTVHKNHSSVTTCIHVD